MLLDDNVLTEEEYQAQKVQILKKNAKLRDKRVFVVLISYVFNSLCIAFNYMY